MGVLRIERIAVLVAALAAVGWAAPKLASKCFPPQQGSPMQTRLMLVSFTCLVLTLPAPAQSALPPEVLNLSKIRRQAAAAVTQAPNYACLETVERYARDNAKSKWRQVDTLLLEVGMIGGKEIYSWPGEESFEDMAPGEMISSGMVSTGEFSQLPRAVFAGGALDGLASSQMTDPVIFVNSPRTLETMRCLTEN
jgi:hypothetical protein